MKDTSVWPTATIQLTISIFPQEFLPKILGYSLHFEAVKLETLIMAPELRELGMGPSYFTFHISIDNADSDYATMVSHAVGQYLEIVGADARGRP